MILNCRSCIGPELMSKAVELKPKPLNPRTLAASGAAKGR